ncbi:MAG: SAM-dependent methyltransferase [Oscillospiraceae bacterium]|nr:SAM-dependent methyltransferase [Candidatus Equicaccousia limihippi]
MDKRLIAAAELITPCSTVADIGTDHAYLPLYLIKNGIAQRVIASDVNKLPLSKAEHNVKENGAESSIDLRLSFGFDNYTAGELDCAFICGMGGENIASILEKAKIPLDFPMVLQPMSRPEYLLKYLADNRYELIKHTIVLDMGRYYNLLLVQKIMNEKSCGEDAQSGENWYQKPLFTIIGKLDLDDATVREYLERKLAALEKSAAQLKNAPENADKNGIVRTAKALRKTLFASQNEK